MKNSLDMEIHLLNEIINKANGTGTDFDEKMSQNLNEKIMAYLKFRALDSFYTTDNTVFQNFEGPCQLGCIPDDGKGFSYID